MNERFVGLMAAAPTPTRPDGEVALELIEPLAEHLVADGVQGVFVGGTSGECHSFSCQERMDVAARWIEVTRGMPFQVIVHVGSNALPEARAMALHAEQSGADAIASMCPFFFKPTTVEPLVGILAEIGKAAPATPLYYYDIPSMTGVHLPLMDLLRQARQRIPTLRGLKYTNSDFMQMQRCMQFDGGYFDILFGHDAVLAGGWTYGIRGAIGTTYNFMAPLYHRMQEAWERRDEERVRQLQGASADIITDLFEMGFLPACRVLMEMQGIQVGPPRLPLLPLAEGERDRLEAWLVERDFQQWRS